MWADKKQDSGGKVTAAQGTREGTWGQPRQALLPQAVQPEAHVPGSRTKPGGRRGHCSSHCLDWLENALLPESDRTGMEKLKVCRNCMSPQDRNAPTPWGPHRGRRPESKLSPMAGGRLASVTKSQEHHQGAVTERPNVPGSHPGTRASEHSQIPSGTEDLSMQVLRELLSGLVHPPGRRRQDLHLLSLSEGCPLVWSTTCI